MEASPIIYSDEQRIMQVLICLQSNALKFTKKGEVKHQIQIVERTDEKTHKTLKFLEINVSDTGIGI